MWKITITNTHDNENRQVLELFGGFPTRRKEKNFTLSHNDRKERPFVDLNSNSAPKLNSSLLQE